MKFTSKHLSSVNEHLCNNLKALPAGLLRHAPTRPILQCHSLLPQSKASHGKHLQFWYMTRHN